MYSNNQVMRDLASVAYTALSFQNKEICFCSDTNTQSLNAWVYIFVGLRALIFSTPKTNLAELRALLFSTPKTNLAGWRALLFSTPESSSFLHPKDKPAWWTTRMLHACYTSMQNSIGPALLQWPREVVHQLASSAGPCMHTLSTLPETKTNTSCQTLDFSKTNKIWPKLQ